MANRFLVIKDPFVDSQGRIMWNAPGDQTSYATFGEAKEGAIMAMKRATQDRAETGDIEDEYVNVKIIDLSFNVVLAATHVTSSLVEGAYENDDEYFETYVLSLVRVRDDYPGEEYESFNDSVDFSGKPVLAAWNL